MDNRASHRLVGGTLKSMSYEELQAHGHLIPIRLTNKDVIERVRRFGTHAKSQRSLTAYIRTCEKLENINFTASITA